MNVIFNFYFFREAFISDRVTLFSYYLNFHLVSMETNKITKHTLISTIIIIIKLPGASGRSLLVFYNIACKLLLFALLNIVTCLATRAVIILITRGG